MRSNIKYTYTLLILLFALNGCKKVYPDLPYHEILSFSIEDANGAPLKGVVENNQILIYWPQDQAMPQQITPVFVISDKATVQPASGTAIAFNETSIYTVTAEDGSTSTYTLKPVINPINPLITRVYGTRVLNGRNYATTTQAVEIAGDFFNTAAGQVKVFYINSSNEVAEAKVSNVTPIVVSSVAEVPAGTYNRIKVVSSGKATEFFYDFDVIQETKPVIPLTSFKEAVTVKRGGQLTITGGVNLDKITSVQLFNATTLAYIPVTLKTAAPNSITLEIPADLPLANYNRIRYYHPPGEYYTATFTNLTFTNFPITVTQ
ncbi:hypothetical protein [Pedobacter metabolipauper]|uniref:IPT/TIG domain-containing protein n=1 Tax=Pedobacter metabolipauper TaxID=425513 RepID=A0A4R6SX94_9SPHI|nr:hypothetical protein [Pedobacter metabolipauper]TDQ09783.1 hypothetical protein ATK78_1942 [Pedobacter metabolipauper]